MAPRKKKLSLFADGGVKSRKMWMAVGASMLIFLGAALAARYPAFAPNYDTFVGGQVAVLLAYCGGNVGAKFVNRGQPAAGAPPEDEEEPAEVKG